MDRDTRLIVIKEQLGKRLNNDVKETEERSKSDSGRIISLLESLRRLRAQHRKDTDNNRTEKEVSGLSLLNSMRRCVSFAERRESFESGRMWDSSDQQVESTPESPEPKGNIKDTPQFATLQELFQFNSSLDKEPKKSKMPIKKLSKDDWNVKCWEERLREANGRLSIKCQVNEPVKSEKREEVFKDRIKEISDKLVKIKDSAFAAEGQGLSQSGAEDSDSVSRGHSPKPGASSRAWIEQLKEELLSGEKMKSQKKFVPRSRPIRKLFEDDDEDDDNEDGSDVEKGKAFDPNSAGKIEVSQVGS